MKKTDFKGLFYAFLLPLGASLLLMAISSFFYRFYYEWYWIGEWMVYLPDMMSYYLMLGSVFAVAGVTAHLVLFRSPVRAGIFAALSALSVAVFPLFRFGVRALIFLGAADAETIFTYFLENLSDAVTDLLYFALALLVLVLERLFFAFVLKETPSEAGHRVFSPKHPTGLALLIYFAALFTISLILFLSDGDFSGSSIFSLALEAGLDFMGFFIAAAFASLASFLQAASETKVRFLDIEDLFARNAPIEIVFSLRRPIVDCRMSKRYEEDAVHFALMQKGETEAVFSSFDQMVNAPFLDEKSLLQLWKRAVVLSIDGGDPCEKILAYLC